MTTPVVSAVPWAFAFSMQAEQSIVVDPKSPGGVDSPHGLILFDGVCVLCSRGCGFVSKRDRRGYFRYVPMQLAEGRPLAEQLGINPDRPDSFAFVANGQASVKSEAVLRIARELPRWQWTWLFHFIPRVIRDAIYDLVARNRIAGSAVVTLASCRIQIVRGDQEPPRDCRTMVPGAGCAASVIKDRRAGGPVQPSRSCCAKLCRAARSLSLPGAAAVGGS